MEKRNPIKIYENENQAIVNLSDGKIPPQALDLEEAVLGAMLIDEKGVNEVIDILSPEVFYKKSHQLIDSLHSWFYYCITIIPWSYECF